LVPLSQTDRWASGKSAASPVFVLKPARERSWMMPVSSYIVILNLIANLSFLYHKPEKPAVTRID
jgi:hypothetical protein